MDNIATSFGAQVPLIVDRNLLDDLPAFGPRYTSYPTADRFASGFPEAGYEALLRGLDAPAIGVYVHVPFCRTVCYFCACNKVITANYLKAERYLGALHKEIEHIGRLLPHQIPVSDLHFGGGTPTYLKDEDLAGVVHALRDTFGFEPELVGAIELHPQTVSPARLSVLADLGFTRISLGVQDFDPQVQDAVNRHQSVVETAALIEKARELGMRSTNIDLIYGLPRQTLEGFGRTLDCVIDLRPDRVALYRYAHLPSRFKAQRQIVDSALPTGKESLDLMEMALRRMADAGYVYIGMDHFSLPDDELAIAQREGRLRRDFQGYTARRPDVLIGLGVSAIGKVGRTYVQNTRELPEYERSIGHGNLAVTRGMQLNRDDAQRADVIEHLMCDGELDIGSWERRWGCPFAGEYATEIDRLAVFSSMGLVRVEPGAIRIIGAGRLLVRHVCQVFDAYLANPALRNAQYSRNH
ncbi:MAG: oxygen-independent coproporphyrinogen III oxidase [Betaproteobacteria bacterium]